MQKQSLKKRNHQVIHSVISHTCNLANEQNLAVYIVFKISVKTSQVHRTHILCLEYWLPDQISPKPVFIILKSKYHHLDFVLFYKRTETSDFHIFHALVINSKSLLWQNYTTSRKGTEMWYFEIWKTRLSGKRY